MERVLVDIAQTYGLELIETTSDMGGYPRYIKDAIIGFNTFSEAQELADRYGLRVQYFEKKAGWQLWYRTGNMAYEEYDYEAIVNETAWMDGSKTYIPGDNSKEDIMDTLRERLSDAVSINEMQELIDHANDVLYRLDECCPDEFLIVTNGEYDGKCPRSCMSYSYDTRYYAIGIAE